MRKHKGSWREQARIRDKPLLAASAICVRNAENVTGYGTVESTACANPTCVKNLNVKYVEKYFLGVMRKKKTVTIKH